MTSLSVSRRGERITVLFTQGLCCVVNHAKEDYFTTLFLFQALVRQIYLLEISQASIVFRDFKQRQKRRCAASIIIIVVVNDGNVWCSASISKSIKTSDMA